MKQYVIRIACSAVEIVSLTNAASHSVESIRRLCALCVLGRSTNFTRFERGLLVVVTEWLIGVRQINNK